METQFESVNLSHLGIVAGMCDKLGVVGLTDRLIWGDEERQKVSTGICLKALILIGLGFSERRLYMVSSFFEDKPVAHLLGEGVEAGMLNDDRLGRSLDAIYEFGVSEFFMEFGKQAAQKMGLDKSPRFYHLDSTSFHVDGNYPSSGCEDCLEVRQGYSRDHRPDLKQVMLNLLVENTSGIPLMMEALSGNTDDKTSFRAFIEKYAASLSAEGMEPQCWVADSALYTQTTLQSLAGQKWLTRVPETNKAAKALILNTETAEMGFFDREEYSGYQYVSVRTNYADVPQRWLIVRSEQAHEREKKTFNKQFLSGSIKEYKAFEKLSGTVYNCQADAQKAANKFVADLKYGCLYEMQLCGVKGFKQKGKPSKDAVKELVGWRIKGDYVCCPADYQQSVSKLGRFILASNTFEEEFSDTELLAGYKGQAKVERGFRFMKDKQFMASTMFVKKPERLEVILMLMAMCLTVYSCLEKELREQLQKNNQTVPNQSQKPTDKPTMRWIFALFTGIHILYILNENKTLIINVKDLHRRILGLFSEEIQKYYKLE